MTNKLLPLCLTGLCYGTIFYADTPKQVTISAPETALTRSTSSENDIWIYDQHYNLPVTMYEFLNNGWTISDWKGNPSMNQYVLEYGGTDLSVTVDDCGYLIRIADNCCDYQIMTIPGQIYRGLTETEVSRRLDAINAPWYIDYFKNGLTNYCYSAALNSYSPYNLCAYTISFDNCGNSWIEVELMNIQATEYEPATPDYTYPFDTEYDHQQTAPMPDYTIHESDLIGKWSPDINAAEPIIIEFYMDNGQLKYDYYRILLGNGFGFNIRNERTKFEFNNGDVIFYGNQGTCNCLVTNSSKSYIDFYLDEIHYGIITDQSDGTAFYRVYE